MSFSPRQIHAWKTLLVDLLNSAVPVTYGSGYVYRHNPGEGYETTIDDVPVKIVSMDMDVDGAIKAIFKIGDQGHIAISGYTEDRYDSWGHAGSYNNHWDGGAAEVSWQPVTKWAWVPVAKA